MRLALLKRYSIPRILHSRSQLKGVLYECPDGACNLFLMKHTYPELFEMKHFEIKANSPSGWKEKGSNQKYLWFPTNNLTESEKNTIRQWIEKFEQYVLIGLNDHLKRYFTTELDFCMALDFRATIDEDDSAINRTETGSLVYELKNDFTNPSKRRDLQKLIVKLKEAFKDLPLTGVEVDILLQTIPVDKDKKRLPQVLTEMLANDLSLEFDLPVLNINKPEIKNVPLEKKLQVWNSIYQDSSNIEFIKDVTGKLVIVIDDLYQSGFTLWSFASYLKQKGAKYVIGLVCVKNMRDTDNS